MAIERCSYYGIKFIAGIEFSTDLDGCEIHILGYGIDYNKLELKKLLNQQYNRRLWRLKELLNNLNTIGFKIDYTELLETFSKARTLGRMHIAEMLKRKKYVKSIGEAFNKYIGDNGIANVKKINYTTKEIIHLIKRLNGISVLAHPEENSAKDKLQELIKLGIDGIEVIHPSHTKTKIDFYTRYADMYGLVKTGGSDFHGISNYEAKNLGKYYIDIESNCFEKFYLN